jgi:hypothetical protein
MDFTGNSLIFSTHTHTHDSGKHNNGYGHLKTAITQSFNGSGSQNRVCAEVFLDGYKGIHLTIKVKSFSGGLSQRQIPVCNLAIRSLDLPLEIIIGLARREEDITYK